MDEITVLVHIRAVSTLPATGVDVVLPLVVALALCAVGSLLLVAATPPLVD